MPEEVKKQEVKQLMRPGRFVSTRSMEARSMVRLMQECDGYVVYLRNRLGRDGFDTEKAMELLKKCGIVENELKELVKELKNFIKEQEDAKKQKVVNTVETAATTTVSQ